MCNVENEKKNVSKTAVGITALGTCPVWFRDNKKMNTEKRISKKEEKNF